LKKRELEPNGEPRGWALSLSISKLAEKHNLINCPQCNEPFKFIESHGFYKCNKCRYQGGLKKFAKLILKEKDTK